jgi:hypothetical protein
MLENVIVADDPVPTAVAMDSNELVTGVGNDPIKPSAIPAIK